MAKILIIDDDKDRNQLFEVAFTGKHDLLFATDGEQGFALAVKEKPRMIILDVMLPGGLNGFEVLEKLKGTVETANIGVIVQTNLEGQKEAAMDAGAIDTILKAQMSMEEIEKMITNLLPSEPEKKEKQTPPGKV